MEDTTEIAGVSVPSPISMQVAPSTSTSSSRCRNRLRCIARLTCTSLHGSSQCRHTVHQRMADFTDAQPPHFSMVL